MPKPGIKIIDETIGTGPEIKRGDRIRLTYDIQLNRGDYLVKDQEPVHTVGDRELIVGFRYGLEGMRVGGTRRFKASHHLCYRDTEVLGIPRNALMIIHIKNVEVIPGI